jgi:hypothetical protein
MLPATFRINGEVFSRTSLDRVVEMALRDAAGTPAAHVEVRLATLGGDRQDVERLPGRADADWADWRDFSKSEQYLLSIANNLTDITSDSPAELLAEIASLVQDYVIDNTGRPWPTRVVSGREVVLDVFHDGEERAWWGHGSHVEILIGRLSSPE